jgi:hypothetical protein
MSARAKQHTRTMFALIGTAAKIKPGQAAPVWILDHSENNLREIRQFHHLRGLTILPFRVTIRGTDPKTAVDVAADEMIMYAVSWGGARRGLDLFKGGAAAIYPTEEDALGSRLPGTRYQVLPVRVALRRLGGLATARRQAQQETHRVLRFDF